MEPLSMQTFRPALRRFAAAYCCIRRRKAAFYASFCFPELSGAFWSFFVAQFEILGEAAKKVSPKFREKHRAIPCSQMAKMRDVLIHHDWDVTTREQAVTETNSPG